MNHFPTIAKFRVWQEAESLALQCAIPAFGSAFLMGVCVSIQWNGAAVIFGGLTAAFGGMAVGAWVLGRRLK